MKAIISSTYSDLYLFYLPITTWCWNRLGVDVICFIPNPEQERHFNKKQWSALELVKDNLPYGQFQSHEYSCPEHKEATYSQCSRLYAAALDLPEDEILITSDVDMAVFKNIFDPFSKSMFNIGYDLVPENQLPMCYTWGTTENWRKAFNIGNKSYQESLDKELAHEECENMRGNLWSRDQELLYNNLMYSGLVEVTKVSRARQGTQFATNRLDRDDAFLLDRLSPDIIDYHMPRPGYEESNFNQILTVLKYFYPNDNFDWLINYRQQYISLL